MLQPNPASPPRPPQRYWDDSQWAIQNIQALTASFPNEWVAVFNKQVVAHHHDLDQVLTTTQSSRLNSPVIKFIERGIHVYNLAGVSNKL